MTKNLKGVILAAMMMLSVSALTTQAKAATTGSCGKTATYQDDGKGTMIIRGTGKVDKIPGYKEKESSNPITKIVISEGITELDCDFGSTIYMGSVEKVTLPSTITNINKTFASTKIKSIQIPASVKTLKEGAFRNCSNLTSVTLNEGLVSIGENAFSGCSQIKKITIPKTVTIVGKNAFQEMDMLASFTNNSSATCVLPTKRTGARNLLQQFYINEKKTLIVPTGKTAVAKWKKYKVTLKANGGKIAGKKIKTHTYGSNEKLPKVKKKGYVFCGWDQLGDSYGKNWSCSKIEKYIEKNVTYKAIFKKITVNKTKKKIVIHKAGLKSGNTMKLYLKLNGKTELIKVTKAKLKDSTKRYSYQYNKKKDQLTITTRKKIGKKSSLKISWWQSYDVENGISTAKYKVF